MNIDDSIIKFEERKLSPLSKFAYFIGNIRLVIVLIVIISVFTALNYMEMTVVDILEEFALGEY